MVSPLQLKQACPFVCNRDELSCRSCAKKGISRPSLSLIILQDFSKLPNLCSTCTNVYDLSALLPSVLSFLKTASQGDERGRSTCRNPNKTTGHCDITWHEMMMCTACWLLNGLSCVTVIQDNHFSNTYRCIQFSVHWLGVMYHSTVHRKPYNNSVCRLTPLGDHPWVFSQYSGWRIADVR